MKAITYLLGAALALIFFVTPVNSGVCHKENSLDRLTEAFTPADHYFIIDGQKLDLFIKNANDLYNIGWIRADISKIYVVDAEVKAAHQKFQIEWLFFIDNDNCIQYYQDAYRAIVDLLLAEKPCEVLGTTC
jgi:hypothetical protein